MHWVSGILVALLGYIYVGYPLFIWVLSRWREHPVRKGPFEGGVAVLVSAYNEAETLPRKLENLLERAKTEPIREIWIGLDGCTDDSANQVQSCLNRIAGLTGRERMGEEGKGEVERRFNIQYSMSNVQDGRGGLNPVPCSTSLSSFSLSAYPKVTILDFKTRRGKAAVLNALMAQASQPILVMMDARQRVEAGAISRLMENFADPQVGVVSGAMVYEATEGAAQKGAESYWGYEKFIRECESRYWAVPGATGALYAIRRELCGPIPESTLVDDVLIPMRAVMKGFRCLFEPEARVFDTPTTDFSREQIRKRRTLAGIWQLVFIEPKIYSRSVNPIWFQWISHKFLRLLTPMIILGVLISTGMMSLEVKREVSEGWSVFGCGICELVFWVTVFIIITSGIAYVLGRSMQSRILGLMGAFGGVNWALIQAAWDAGTGRLDARWRK